MDFYYIYIILMPIPNPFPANKAFIELKARPGRGFLVFSLGEEPLVVPLPDAHNLRLGQKPFTI
jgi:hypothetical protein